MSRKAVITGATAGIGRSTALKLAENGYDVIITGRRSERLESVKEAIEKNYSAQAYILSFDIRDKHEVFNAIDSLPDEWKDIRVLVNNAGLAVGLNHIQEGEIDDWERMIDTNIKKQLYITNLKVFMVIKK